MLLLSEVLSNPDYQCLTLVNQPKCLSKRITRVNRVENQEVLGFIKDAELVIFLFNPEKMSVDKLMSLICQMKARADIAGLVITCPVENFTVTEEVMTLGNQLDVAILILPWSIRIADFTYSLTKLLIEKKQSDDTIDQFIALGIQNDFAIDAFPNQIGDIFVSGKNDRYSLFMIEISENKESNPNALLAVMGELSLLLNRYHILHIISQSKERLILITKSQGSDCAIYLKIMEKVQCKFKQIKLVMSRGGSYAESNLKQSYDEVVKTHHMNSLSECQQYLSYDELGIYQLLLAFDDIETFQQFHEHVFGNLIKFDQLQQKNYYQFLKIYFEENGQINQIAKRLYLHRNSVVYRIKRIADILKIDFNNYDDLLYIALALSIEKLPGFQLKVSDKDYK